MKRLKDLETENTRLRKAISDLTLDKLILQEAAKGNFQTPRADVSSSSTSGAHSRYPSVEAVSKARAFSTLKAQIAAAHAGRKAARVRATRFWP